MQIFWGRLGQRTPEPDGHPSRDPGGGPRGPLVSWKIQVFSLW